MDLCYDNGCIVNSQVCFTVSFAMNMRYSINLHDFVAILCYGGCFFTFQHSLLVSSDGEDKDIFGIHAT